MDTIGRFCPIFLQNVSFIYVTKPQNLFGVVWRRFTPLKQPRKLTLGVLQNLLSNSVNSASLFYCLLDLAWASWLEQRTFKIYWVTQYILKMSPFDLRQHWRLTIWNNLLSWQTVPEDKFQKTWLILERGALSREVCDLKEDAEQFDYVKAGNVLVCRSFSNAFQQWQ